MSTIHFSLAELRAALVVCCGTPGFKTESGRRQVAAALAEISAGNAAQWNRTYRDDEPAAACTAQEILGRSPSEGALRFSPRWNEGMATIRALQYNTDGAEGALALVQRLALHEALEAISEQREEIKALKAQRAA